VQWHHDKSHSVDHGQTLPEESMKHPAGALGSFLVEDDYDSEFRYTGRPLAAIQGLDPEAIREGMRALSCVL
jgi:hypothetical protein